MKNVDWTKPIKFRGNDQPVRFASFIKNGAPGIDKAVVIYSIDSNPNYEIVSTCDLDGTYYALDPSWDIINVPIKKTYYVNVYKSSSGLISFGSAYDDKEEAKSWVGGKDFVKTISFEVEE